MLAGLGMLICTHTVYADGKDIYSLTTEFVDPGDDTDPYASEWRRIDSLMELGLAQTAYKLVDGIYLRAKREQQDLPLIKCLVYRINLLQQLEPTADSIGIAMLSQELFAARAPGRQLMQSMLAERYQHYFSLHQQAISSRLSVPAGDDFGEWDADRFQTEIARLYEASLQPHGYLQQLDVSMFSSLLTGQVDSDRLRPSVYDLLAHRALDYFLHAQKPGNTTLSRSEWAKRLIVPGTEFLQVKIREARELTALQKPLEIFQQLLAFHYIEDATAPFVDTELRRLKFLRNSLSGPEADAQYRKVLTQLAGQYITHPVYAEIQYEIARFYKEQAQQYEPASGTAHKWDMRKAREAARKAIANYPHSYGSEQCRTLVENLEKPRLAIELEEVQLPNQPFRIACSYANVDTVWMHVFSVSQTTDYEGVAPEDRMRGLYESAASYIWPIPLLNDGDYQQHRVEILLPELSAGTYLLATSLSSESHGEAEVLAVAETQVSGISFYYREEEGVFQVVDRMTGKPLEGATVSIRYWSLSDSAYEATQRFQTDVSGSVALGIMDSARYAAIAIQYKQDQYLAGPVYLYPGKSAQRQVSGQEAYFFTDRNRYHPGERIGFKALLMGPSTPNRAPVPGTAMRLFLMGEGGIPVDTVQGITNEFGTITGAFRIPLNGWSSHMALRAEQVHAGTTWIEVAPLQQQDPLLEIQIDTLRRVVGVEEKIPVSGSIQLAASGRKIADASVFWRVDRKQLTAGLDMSEDKDTRDYRWVRIEEGETKTDKDGRFSWDFISERPHITAPVPAAVWVYRIQLMSADNIGNKGFLHTEIFAGARTLTATVSIPEVLSTHELHKVQVDTRRISGEKIATRGRIRVFPLIAPTTLVRNRRWTRPDRNLIQVEPSGTFAGEVESEIESDPQKWKRGNPIIARIFDTSVSGQLDLAKLDTAAQGPYVLELLTRDEQGREIRVENYFTLYNPGIKVVGSPEWVEVYPLNPVAQPGETITLTLGSMEKNMQVLMSVLRANGSVDSRYLKLGAKRKRVNIMVPENAGGDLEVTFSGVYNNTFFQKKISITIREVARQAEIVFSGFEAEHQAGEPADWQIQLMSPTGSVTNMELMAALVDDTNPENTHAFRTPQLFTSVPALHWEGTWGFGRLQGQSMTGRRLPIIEGMDRNVKSYRQIDWRGTREPGGYVEYPDTDWGESAEMQIPNIVWQQQRATLLKDRKALQDTWEEAAALERPWFFPQLQPAQEGAVVLDFPLPDVVGEWRLLTLAHTADGQFAYAEKSVSTRKKLALTVESPTFARVGDQLVLSTSITNLMEYPVAGKARLEIVDAMTGKAIATEALVPGGIEQVFRIYKMSESRVEWKVEVPAVSGLFLRIQANANGLVDQQEWFIPIFADLQCLRINAPIVMTGAGAETFSVLADPAASTGTEMLDLEVSEAPAWYALQAIPGLMESSIDHTSAIFDRYYAHLLAQWILGPAPRISGWVENCKREGKRYHRNRMTEALAYPQVVEMMRSEAPWQLSQYKGDESTEKLCAHLQPEKVAAQLDSLLTRLLSRQLENGGFAGFPQFRANRNLTHMILTELGRMQYTFPDAYIPSDDLVYAMAKGISFLDQQIKKDYETLTRKGSNTQVDKLGESHIRYLYMRSLFRDIPHSYGSQVAYEYYLNQARNYWKLKHPGLQAMIAWVMHRNGEIPLSLKMIENLRESAQTDEQGQLYWEMEKESSRDPVPVEFHGILMEVFREFGNGTAEIPAMTAWLLAQRKGQQWPGSGATRAAVDALLLSSSEWLNTPESEVRVLEQIEIASGSLTQGEFDARNGYLKSAWQQAPGDKQTHSITLRKIGEETIWGALNLQYLRPLSATATKDLAVSAERSYSLLSAEGKQIQLLELPYRLKKGDKIQAQIELNVTADLKGIVIKDAHVAGLERSHYHSTSVSGDGLEYFSTANPATTEYYFDELPKGNHILTYELEVVHPGTFKQGYLSISSSTSPEKAYFLPGDSFLIE